MMQQSSVLAQQFLTLSWLPAITRQNNYYAVYTD